VEKTHVFGVCGRGCDFAGCLDRVASVLDFGHLGAEFTRGQQGRRPRSAGYVEELLARLQLGQLQGPSRQSDAAWMELAAQ
jgi:hypothetical protein